jgi:hypothetical protein
LTLKFRFRPFSAGTYPVTFTTKVKSSDIQVYSFNITVAEASDCAPYLVGKYKEIQNCSSSMPYFHLGQIFATKYPNRVYIANPGGNQSYINCADKTITTPSAPGVYTDFYGTGSFSHDSVFLHVTYLNSAYKISDTCDIIMVRE